MAVNLLAVLPVISLSFICHYNVHPIAHSLERWSNRRMMMVIRRAVSRAWLLIPFRGALSHVVVLGRVAAVRVVLAARSPCPPTHPRPC